MRAHCICVELFFSFFFLRNICKKFAEVECIRKLDKEKHKENKKTALWKLIIW